MGVPRLLIVAHQFAPSAATGARRSTRLAAFLRDRGKPPAVVTAPVEFYGKHVREESAIREELRTHEVRPPVPGKAALTWAYGAAIRRALRERPPPDYLYFCGNPFWYFPLGRYFQLTRGSPYILDFADLYYPGHINYRLGHRSGVRLAADLCLERIAVAGARLVVCTTPEQTAIYRRRFPRRPEAGFATVRWGFDSELLPSVTPAERSDTAVLRVAIFGKFAVYDAAHAEMLAQAVAALEPELPADVMHMGRPEPELAAAFRRAGVEESLRCRGMLPYRQGLAELAASDCLALNAISDVSLPAKVYDYIGLNKPILAFVGPGTALARLLRGFDGALLAADAGAAAGALRHVGEGAVECLQPGLDTTEFSQQRQFERLLDAIGSAEAARGAP